MPSSRCPGGARLRVDPDHPHTAGGRAAAIGQPQRRDHPTPVWLLSAAGGNSEPAQAADAEGRQSVFDHPDEVEGTIAFTRGVRREVACIE